MAAYCDNDFYTNEYKGTAIEAADLGQALTHASFKVDQATRYLIDDIADWPPFTQKQIKLAVCAQADSDYLTDDEKELGRFLGVAGGYSIGDVSVSGGGAGTGAGGATSGLEGHYGLCLSAIRFLMPTGLLDRRIR